MSAPCTGPAGTGRIVETYPGGWTLLERDGVRFNRHLHTGARMACLGADPADPSRMVVAIEGGAAEGPGRETESVLFRVSPDGLEAMALDLLRAVHDHRERRAIDIRMVL